MFILNSNHSKQSDLQKPAFFWIQDTPFGKEVFLALYTKQCAWKKCTFCTLGTVSSPEFVEMENVLIQVVSSFTYVTSVDREIVRRFFLSNNGSIFDESTLTNETLKQICYEIFKTFPNIENIGFETRIEYVNHQNISELQTYLFSIVEYFKKTGSRTTGKNLSLSISIGYETHNSFLRNDILQKGYSSDKIDNFYKMCSSFDNEQVQVICDEYVMLKPCPNLSDDEAVEECVQSILYLEEMSKLYSLQMLVRLNPTYVAVNSELELAFDKGEFVPPKMINIVQVLQNLHNKINIPLFIGLNEEGLAVKKEGASFNRNTKTDKLIFKALEQFNRTQNYQALFDAVGYLPSE